MHHFAQNGRIGQKGWHKSSPGRIFMTSLRSRCRKARDPFDTCINDERRAIWIALYIVNWNNIHTGGGKSITFSISLSKYRRDISPRWPIKVTLLPKSVLSQRETTAFIIIASIYRYQFSRRVIFIPLGWKLFWEVFAESTLVENIKIARECSYGAI